VPASATAIDSKTPANRFVADDIEVITMPNGDVITRLVSKNGLTARQFWADSVYPQGAIVVFQGQGNAAQSRGVAQSGQQGERRISQTDRALKDAPDVYAGRN
jgi:hypothetical protein